AYGAGRASSSSTTACARSGRRARALAGRRSPPRSALRASAAELRELYAGAAYVVVPQRRQDYAYGSEGGGLTSLLETLAMARPLVASDRPILRDYVTDEETALLVPPEEPDALAEAIRRVLEDGSSRA